jgi:hypothetical protein
MPSALRRPSLKGSPRNLEPKLFLILVAQAVLISLTSEVLRTKLAAIKTAFKRGKVLVFFSGGKEVMTR